MEKIIAKLYKKLFVFKWTIGYIQGSIREIIRSKSFDPHIHWIDVKADSPALADPFLFKSDSGNYDILFEDFSQIDNYGKIAVMKLDEKFNLVDHKILLDVNTHLSYPFMFRENNKNYVFPESAQSGKLSCYEYDSLKRSLVFCKDIIDQPVLDPTILKYNNRYWLFGTLRGNDSHNKLYIYHADNLLGPYKPHHQNPVKNKLNGSRPAGNFIEVDGVLYRPSQNCVNIYGESIGINKIVLLTENEFQEVPYMTISINKKRKSNAGIQRIHTINVMDDLIVVDGKKYIFSPEIRIRNAIKKRTGFLFRKKLPKSIEKLPAILISDFVATLLIFQ